MDALIGEVRPEQVAGNEGRDRDAIQEEIMLLGQPTLGRYLDYMTETVIGGASLQRNVLVDEWRAANDLYYDLETSEAGLADHVEILDLPAPLKPLVSAIRAESSYRRAFDMLPTRFAMVQLDRVVASQRRVNLSHAKRLRAHLGASPSLEQLFRFSLPLDRPDVRVGMHPSGKNRFTLWSESSDFRFQEAVLFRPEQIAEHAAKGVVSGVVGLMVGFGSNFLCAAQSGSRLLLVNGHHRAYALLEQGITHAPCIIETVTRLDELALVADSDVLEAPAFYFKSPRPPLLKDFLDPRIRKVVSVPRKVHMIDVSFKIREYSVSD